MEMWLFITAVFSYASGKMKMFLLLSIMIFLVSHKYMLCYHTFRFVVAVFH